MGPVNQTELSPAVAPQLTMQRVLYLTSLLTAVSTVQQNLEDKFDLDTKKCTELARSRHPTDPSASLDHFLLCLTSHLEKIPEDDEGELRGLKNTLREIEENKLFLTRTQTTLSNETQ